MDPYSPVNRSRNGYAERKERIEMKKSYEEFQKEEFHNKKLPWRFWIVSIVVIAIAVCVTAIVLYEIHPDRERRFKVCPAEMEGKTGCTFVGSRLVVAKCVGGVWDKANANFATRQLVFSIAIAHDVAIAVNTSLAAPRYWATVGARPNPIIRISGAKYTS